LSEAPPESSASVLQRALRTLLRPLVRLMLARQIPYPALAALLKETYVEVADRDFRLADKRQTDSRVSLLTGVHRKDVSRLRANPPSDDAPPRSVSLGAQIVARWVAEDRFLDAAGHPLPLPRHAAAAGAPSFERLVESVSKDIRPRAVLDEWVRLGIASVDGDGVVRLDKESFVPEKGFDEKAYYFGRNLRDHIAAAAHNLAGEGSPFIERSVYYAHLSSESVDELARLSEELGMDALRAVNRRALALQRRDAEAGGGAQRMNFGVYFFEAPLEDAPDLHSQSPDRSSDGDEPGDADA
jgi:hypothetical protein